jgi:predicted LPLAT superfamily acyltransferase
MSDAQRAERATEVAWLTREERGAMAAIGFVFWLARRLGRRPARLFLRIVAAQYVLTDRAARSASASWLSTVYGRPARLSEIYQHILRFAHVTLDRVFLLLGAHELFVVNRTGKHHLNELTRQKRGAILVGAHLAASRPCGSPAPRSASPSTSSATSRTRA